MSKYLSVASPIQKTSEEEDVVITPKTRKARGTSPLVDVKIRRDVYTLADAVAKRSGLKAAEVIEKILESRLASVEETLQSLRIENIV